MVYYKCPVDTCHICTTSVQSGGVKSSFQQNQYDKVPKKKETKKTSSFER